MFYIRCIILLLLIPCYQGCNADAGSMFTLLDVKDQIKPVIIISPTISNEERDALNVLKKAFLKASETEIKVITEQSGSQIKGTKIYLGNTLASAKLHLSALKKDGYIILQKEDAIYLVSQSKQGLFYAVYDFIESYLHGFKPDEGEIIYSNIQRISIPSNLKKIEEPSFEFRQAYFPASNNVEYQNWHHTNHLEKEWGCWGHHLGDLIKKNHGKILPECFALIHGERNDEQFCFSSEVLYEQIKKAIQHEISIGNAANKWTIAANDNSLICECAQCRSINSSKSASNSVAQMMNKLAADFPSLQISTLAYSSTYDPPTCGKLAPNCMVILSTIDLPKGMAIEEQSGNFSHWVQSWKQVCNDLYIWDYPIQYTNYVDVFPNLPALQKDLKYFNTLGIKGVFEQGTEYQYGLFAEWKCYAISKLLWNPNIDLNAIRSVFFSNFYGEQGKAVEDFYVQCENNLIQRKSTLDIYGNVQLASKAYLNFNELAAILSTLHKATAIEDLKHPRTYYNLHKVQTCLDLLMLQFQRWKGIGEEGYAEAVDATSWKIKLGLLERISKLKKACTDDEIETINENGELVQTYLDDYDHFLTTSETTNLIWKKAVTYNTIADDSYPANGKFTLVDGMNGTNDYSFNWQLFNNTSMDIAIENVSVYNSKKLSIRFLNDPAHYIFLPKAIHIYVGNSALDAKQIKTFNPSENRTNTATINTFTMVADDQLKHAKYIRIVADGLGDLPDWKSHPTKKPTIACDEINIQ